MTNQDEHYKAIDATDVYDIENSFYLTSEPFRIAKLLGQYEIYKKILSLPGAVVECGVYKGVSLTRFCSFRYAMETDKARKIIGFDAFGAFPKDYLRHQADIDFANAHDNESGGLGVSKPYLQGCLTAKGFTNVELVEGNVIDTALPYLGKNNHLRIALLHLDMDVYEPTKFALETFFSRVVPGGVIMIDDYATVDGATDAVDEFFAGKDYEIQRAPYYQVPAFIVK